MWTSKILAPPGLHAKGQDGEWEVKVSNKNHKSQKQMTISASTTGIQDLDVEKKMLLRNKS